MINFEDYFGKIRSSLFKEYTNKEILSEIISEYLKEKIPTKDIEIKNGVVRIKCNQMLRASLFMKKEKILSEINNKLPKMGIKDIK